MNAIPLSPTMISAIIDDPSKLASPSLLGLSSTTASYILSQGYTRGFRTVFILNACLSAMATIASITMIKHKELTRGDEAELRKEATEEKGGQESKEKGSSVV